MLTHKWESAVRSFDEAHYLSRNPDVAVAVASGRAASAMRHFVHHGCVEGRPSRPVQEPLLALSSKNPYLLPPPHLRARVHGSESELGFDIVGKAAVLDIMHAMTLNSVSIPSNARVLDFGCGPGRTARWFKATFPEISLIGSDIDQEAIAWASENIPSVGTFIANEWMPPLDLPSRSIDFVIAVSVFTHLPEDMEMAWLAELKRVTKPGAILALTVHGMQLAPPTDKPFLYYTGNKRAEGLPGFYQDSYHSEEYIKSEWGRIFDIVSHMPGALNGHQDIVVCRNPMARP